MSNQYLINTQVICHAGYIRSQPELMRDNVRQRNVSAWGAAGPGGASAHWEEGPEQLAVPLAADQPLRAPLPQESFETGRLFSLRIDRYSQIGVGAKWWPPRPRWLPTGSSTSWRRSWCTSCGALGVLLEGYLARFPLS